MHLISKPPPLLSQRPANLHQQFLNGSGRNFSPGIMSCCGMWCKILVFHGPEARCIYIYCSRNQYICHGGKGWQAFVQRKYLDISCNRKFATKLRFPQLHPIKKILAEALNPRREEPLFQSWIIKYVFYPGVKTSPQKTESVNHGFRQFRNCLLNEIGKSQKTYEIGVLNHGCVGVGRPNFEGIRVKVTV